MGDCTDLDNCLGLDKGIVKWEESRSSRGVSKLKKIGTKREPKVREAKGRAQKRKLSKRECQKKRVGHKGKERNQLELGEKKGRVWKS